MLFRYNIDEKGKKKKQTQFSAGPQSVCSAHILPTHAWVFSGTQASSRILKMCTWGELAQVHIVPFWMSVIGSVLEGHPVQGGSSLVPQLPGQAPAPRGPELE